MIKAIKVIEPNTELTYRYNAKMSEFIFKGGCKCVDCEETSVKKIDMKIKMFQKGKHLYCPCKNKSQGDKRKDHCDIHKKLTRKEYTTFKK